MKCPSEMSMPVLHLLGAVEVCGICSGFCGESGVVSNVRLFGSTVNLTFTILCVLQPASWVQKTNDFCFSICCSGPRGKFANPKMTEMLLLPLHFSA